jgi:hypothetical protein
VKPARPWFKAEIGVGRRETPIAAAICTHAHFQPDLFVVPDTLFYLPAI